MNSVILDIIDPKAGLPPALRPYALAYWDARNTPSVSLPLTNIVTNGNFADGNNWTPNGATESVASNTYTCTGTGAKAFPSFYQNYTATIGNQYYVRAKMRVTNASCASLRVLVCSSSVTLQENPTQNTWYEKSAVVPATSDSGSIGYYHYYADAATANGQVMEVQYALAIDLTAAFGAGNEPTAAEMDAILLAYSPTTSWFNGTANLCINPASQIFLPDTSGQNQHLKYRNVGYTAASGPQSGSPPYIKMDGTDDYMRRALAIPFAAGSPITFSCWFRVSNITTTKRIVVLSDSALTSSPTYILITSSTIACAVGGTTSTGYDITGGENKWWNVTLAIGSTGGQSTLYVNGMPVKTVPNVLLTIMANVLLNNNNTLTVPTAGDDADIAIFNKTLTATDVKDAYNYSCARYGKSRI